MIVKILTRHNPSYSSLIKYIIKGSKGIDGKPHIITHNIISTNEAGYVKEFIQNEALRKHPRSNQTYLYHEIISLSAHEDRSKITDAMLTDLAKQYITLRGEHGMFVGAIHSDTQHCHIHLMSSGTEYRSGKAFRLSKSELNTLKISFQNYHLQKYPGLVKSAVSHGQKKAYFKNKEWQEQHRSDWKIGKEQIEAVVQEAFARTTTRTDFLESLRDRYNLQFYERAGVATGIVLEGGMKVRFSRLGVDFLSKSPDRTEEERTLAEIQSIRESRQDRSRNAKDDIAQNNSRDER